MIRCRVCKKTAGPFVPDGRVTTPIDQTSGPGTELVQEICEDCYEAAQQRAAGGTADLLASWETA